MISITGNNKGLTLVELLVVVVIVSVLAAIVTLNVLDMQARSKVSRTQAAFRTAELALEIYAVDLNSYPVRPLDYEDGLTDLVCILPNSLTTPIAYLNSDETMLDPLKHLKSDNRFIQRMIYFDWSNLVNPAIPQSHTRYQDEFADFGSWTLSSVGPDSKVGPLTDPVRPYFGVLYDVTNGTRSQGDLVWSQRRS